jgi:hypothetical protein
MIKFLKAFLPVFALCILVAICLNWMLGKPYYLNNTNVILSLACSLTVFWMAFETRKRMQ